LCSNDYLGYRETGRLVGALEQAARARVASGAGASRLVSGDGTEHRHLEGQLARWLGYDAALLFTSGYAANLGVISALARQGDLVVSDALNHASIVDGCRLSRAQVSVVAHCDLRAVARALEAPTQGRRWVVSESYFSMDGDCADLVGLRELCDVHGAALIVDEAHAIGVFGPQGRGRAALLGVVPDVLVGTLGKAAAGQGAFVCGSASLCAWLWNRSRSFVYSTGLSPVLCALGSEAVRLMAADDGGRVALERNVAELRRALRGIGVPAGGEGPILPVILGSEERTMAWSRGLARRGVRVQAIRPPTVAPGTSRLRVTARADLTARDLETARAAFTEVALEESRGELA